MSKKVDENYIYNKDDDDDGSEENERKCPPTQPVPSLKPDDKWAETAAIEEAFPLNEKEEIKGEPFGDIHASNPNNPWVSNEDRNTAHGPLGGQPDNSLGTEAVDVQRWPCPSMAEQRPRWTHEPLLPGAYQEGGPDIEEGYGEDEFTITTGEENEVQPPVVTCERLIDPVMAEVIDTEGEKRPVQQKNQSGSRG